MLTTAAARAARPGPRAYKRADGAGLFLYVMPTGTKSWRMRWRDAGGREQLMTLGHFPALSIDAARAQRDAARATIAAGQDPRNCEITQNRNFEFAAREWHAHRAPGWSAVHAGDVIVSLERDVFPAIGALPLDTIARPAVLELLERIEERGAVQTARRVRQRIEAACGFARAKGWMSAANPAEVGEALANAPAEGRQPALVDVAEIRALLAAVDELAAASVSKLASRFLALTVVRLAALRGMKWDEVEDLDGPVPTWRVPAARMKLKAAHKGDTARDHLVPLAGSAGTTQFVYDGDQLTDEYDGTGGLLRRYVHGAAEDDPLLWYEGAGVNAASRRLLMADHQGSVVQVVDANGQSVAVDSYDEYGKPSLNNLGRFQYTGQAWLPELRMYHYKARVYSPQLGRFLQTDPVGYDDQVNLYAYVANDPVNGRDPTGLAGDDDLKNLKQADAQLNKAISTLATASDSLGKATTVTQVAEATKDIVVTAPKIAVDSVKVAGAAVVDSITVTSNAVLKAANAIENWLGGRPTVRSHNGNTRVTSPDGSRQFRHETREKTGSVPPHMHLDQRDARGNMRAAPGTPDHIFPQGQQDDEQ